MKEKDHPEIFSLDFHTKFFPSLLWRLLHPEKREYESTFSGHIALEYPAAAVISIMAGVFGLTAALGSGSIIGWICSISGAGIFLYLLIHSIRSRKGYPLSFEYFRTIIFLFFVFLGITMGLVIGTEYHFPYGLKFAAGVAGFLAGYITGIVAGLWVQYLGWMAALLDIVAIAAIAGMIILDIIMLL